jgi:hypothetical protein
MFCLVMSNNFIDLFSVYLTTPFQQLKLSSVKLKDGV